MTAILVQSLIALFAGAAILIFPKILNYIVAGYFIVMGLVGLSIAL